MAIGYELTYISGSPSPGWVPGGREYVATSNDPTGGPAAWDLATLAQQRGDLNSVSCPTSSFCAIAGGYEVLTSTDPAGGASTWVEHGIPNLNGHLESISCPTEQLCVVEDQVGEVFASRDPAAASATWQLEIANPGTGESGGVSCPTTSVCVAGAGGSVWLSNDPAGPPAGWTSSSVDPNLDISDVSCPTDLLCVATDGRGNTLTGRAPTRAELRAQLRRQIRPGRLRRDVLLRVGRYEMPIAGPVPGTVTIRWEATRRLHQAHRRQLTVAGGELTFSTPATRSIAITLSPAGRRLLRTVKRLGIEIAGTYKSAEGVVRANARTAL